MRKIWVSAIYSLLIATATLFATSCSNEYRDTDEDFFHISTDIRSKVTEGIRNVSEADKDDFNTKLEAFLLVCSTPPLSYSSSTDAYMETQEYKDFKEYIVSVAPDSYYLLIDVFLKGDNFVGFFSYIFQDIVEASYPGLITYVLDKLEEVPAENFLLEYPQVCVEQLLYEMEKNK